MTEPVVRPPRAVGVYPTWKENPYLEELERAVAPHGYRCVYPEPSRAQLEISSHVRTHGLDLVHLHWQHPYLLGEDRLDSGLRLTRFLLDLAMVRRMGVPVVWTIHNVVNHERRHAALERLASAALFRAADQVTVHCSGVIRSVRDHYWLSDRQCARVAVLPHGNYHTSYPDPPDPRPARDALGLDPDARVFLHFGNVRGYKHVDFILEGFRRLNDPGATLVIAGGVDDPGLRREIEESAGRDRRVRLLIEDRIPDAEVPRLFAAADVFVYAAFDILMSGAIMLALTHGLPIVAPRVGCLPEVVPDDGVNWYAPRDTSGFLKALQSSDGAWLERAAELNRAASRRYPWDEVGAMWAQVYDRLLEPRSPK